MVNEDRSFAWNKNVTCLIKVGVLNRDNHVEEPL